MINPFRLNQQYRDFWTSYDSFAAAQIDPILEAGCYSVRWYHAPRNADELIQGPGGYLKYSLVIPAGSWILGYWHTVTTGFGANPSFLVMITDVGLNYKFFTSPLPERFFDSNGRNEPSLENTPYPVVDPGTFLVEFWQNNNALNRCQLTFAVAEPVTDAEVP